MATAGSLKKSLIVYQKSAFFTWATIAVFFKFYPYSFIFGLAEKRLSADTT
jgi:hypothetical protein